MELYKAEESGWIPRYEFYFVDMFCFQIEVERLDRTELLFGNSFDHYLGR
jgi:hypothetical protein